MTDKIHESFYRKLDEIELNISLVEDEPERIDKADVLAILLARRAALLQQLEQELEKSGIAAQKAHPPKCSICGEELHYDGFPAWYCGTCGSSYTDTLNRIPDEYDIS